MTEDQSMGEQTIPLSQDRYVYALDNPMKYIDPTGFYSVTTTTHFYFGSNPVETENGLEIDLNEEEITTTTEYGYECYSRYDCTYVETSSSSAASIIGTEVVLISASAEASIGKCIEGACGAIGAGIAGGGASIYLADSCTFWSRTACWSVLAGDWNRICAGIHCKERL